jgi:hypothetical protein
MNTASASRTSGWQPHTGRSRGSKGWRREASRIEQGGTNERVMEAEEIEEIEEEFEGYSGYEGTPHPPYHEPIHGTYDVNDASNTSPTSNVRTFELDERAYVLDDASNASPVPNEHDTEVEGHEFVSSENLTIEQQDRYVRDLLRKAAEYGMAPEELHELNESCLREQQEWLAEQARIEGKPNEGSEGTPGTRTRCTRVRTP